MALYAFDGTGNEDNADDAKDTNVVKFSEAYKDGYQGSGKNFYVEGVGTRKGFIGKVFGSIFGAGGEQRIEEAMEAAQKNFDRGDEIVDIIGFSRGAALALEFANQLREQGINNKVPEINFIGLWDTVASFGIPGNHINLGMTLTIPKNVNHCSHAMALDERRDTFPLTRVIQDKYSDRNLAEIHEAWFRGFHSDVGGGNQNQGLSSISLVWMFNRASDNGVLIPIDYMTKHQELRNPEAKSKKPGMDIIPDKKRTIFPEDEVHESVNRRGLVVSGFESNNPPKGLKVTSDDGGIYDKGFEE